MDERFTPTHRRFGGPMDEFIDELGEPDETGGLSYAQLQRLTEICLFISADDEHGRDLIKTSFDLFQNLSHQFPQAAEGIREALESVVLAIAYHSNEIATTAIEREVATVGALAKRNEAKQQVIARARFLAKQAWAADSNQSIRITEMAHLVKGRLVDEGGDDLPEDLERIKAWIRPVAPSYAKAGGRRKNP